MKVEFRIRNYHKQYNPPAMILVEKINAYGYRETAMIEHDKFSRGMIRNGWKAIKLK